MQAMRAENPALETMNFGPRIPKLQVVLVCLGFGGMGAGLALSALMDLSYALVTPSYLLSNMVLPVALYISAVSFVLSLLQLPFRLTFTAQGIGRRTLLKPHFVPWHGVQAARVRVARGFIGLELRVSSWRWIVIPLTGYARPRALVEAGSRHLSVPVDTHVLERLRLGDDDTVS